MPEALEYDLSDRDRKKMETARLAMTRGNFGYTIEICSEILLGEPGCLEVRRLLRKAQRRVYAEKSKSIDLYLSRLSSYPSLLQGYALLKRKPERSMSIGESILSKNVYNSTEKAWRSQND